MHVVIFEASRWHQFAPLSLSRPLFTLASGMSTLLQKQIRHLRPTKLTLWVRPQLEQFCRERVAPKTGLPTDVNTPLGDEPALLVNGRTCHFGWMEHPEQESVMIDEQGVVLVAMTRSPGLSPRDAWDRNERWLKLLDLPHIPSQGRQVHSIADLVHWNDDSLIEDYAHLKEPSQPKPAGPYHLIDDADVWLGKGAKLGAGCVIDASKGPVVLADGASVGFNAVVQGPCYIGAHATVMPLALIRPGTSIGPLCKIGGEVSMSIILGYSNKSHEGYLGHSYLGKWVNLGAGTTTSNLKNTYGEISLKTAARELSSGWRFLGSFLGDHAKTAIQTRLMAGTYVGFGSMLAGSGPAPRFVPSYTFWTDKGMEPYRLDKAIEVAKRVFARRDRGWTDLDQQMMHYIAEEAPGAEK
ncbi:MAG TPA: putative sugar nucleotidyl transferase [Humisphaera sp.]|jgi:UDP-N-acetylglucosamine diphosphorylase/glucosamine-1-phosphate N-acetyltransferase|nr:putative sugar nucleotidyl transferase [Humisphaera sp.]